MSKEDWFRLVAHRTGCRRTCIKACRLRKFCNSPGMKADGGSETGEEEWTKAHQTRTVESISWEVCEWRRSNVPWGWTEILWWPGFVHIKLEAMETATLATSMRPPKGGGGSWCSETVTRNSDIDLVAQPISTKALVFCSVWTVALAVFFWLTQETIFQNSVKGTNQMVIVLFKATLSTCFPRS